MGGEAVHPIQWLLERLEKRRQCRMERLISEKRTYALLLMLNDRRESVRLDAVRALGCCGDDLACQTLTELLRDSQASVRKAAALALADTNRPDSILSIQRQMDVEKDSPVIDAMHTALFHLRRRT